MLVGRDPCCFGWIDGLVRRHHDRVGQQATDEVVVSLGDAERHLRRSSAIELRRPAGTRTSPTGGTTELHIEQTHLGQLVEMEGGDRPRHAESRRDLVTPDWRSLGDDMAMDASAKRLVEGCQGPDAHLTSVHGSHSKTDLS